MTPLGLPVEPLVYITTARSLDWGFTIGLSTVGQTNSYCLVLYVCAFQARICFFKERDRNELEKYALFSGLMPSSRTDCMLWMESSAG